MVGDSVFQAHPDASSYFIKHYATHRRLFARAMGPRIASRCHLRFGEVFTPVKPDRGEE
jgi:hypothetical protein